MFYHEKVQGHSVLPLVKRACPSSIDFTHLGCDVPSPATMVMLYIEYADTINKQ